MIETLRQMNQWWDGKPIEVKIPRPKYLDILKKNLNNQEALLLIGSRRVGKTTIMRQWIDFLIKNGIPAKNILYALLDHPELKQTDILKIIAEFRRSNGFSLQEKIYVFLDEIQYKKNWDQEVKAAMEMESLKFVLSGSSVSLISRQKNFLTGRYLKYAVQSLDKSEFELFSRNKSIENYLAIGGYPEFVINQDPQYLLDLIDGIIYKDIVEIYKIRQPKIIKDILLILARAVGFKISLNKIAKTLRVSIETVKDYLRFLSEVYLIFEAEKFSSSLNERIYNEKKYYFYDTGLARVLAGTVNFGSLAENAAASYLKNSGFEFGYFYDSGKECDFIVKRRVDRAGTSYLPIEVKFNPDEKENFDLAQMGLVGFYQAKEKVNSATGLIITSGFEKKESEIDLISLDNFIKSGFEKNNFTNL